MTRTQAIEAAARALIAWWDVGDDDGDMEPTPVERVEALRAALAMAEVAPPQDAPRCERCEDGRVLSPLLDPGPRTWTDCPSCSGTGLAPPGTGGGALMLLSLDPVRLEVGGVFNQPSRDLLRAGRVVRFDFDGDDLVPVSDGHAVGHAPGVVRCRAERHTGKPQEEGE